MAAWHRRAFLKGATAAALSLTPRFARAAYPERNIKVVIPTGQGGGADRLARGFAEIWRKLIGVAFEFDFYPGGRRIMYALQGPKPRPAERRTP